MGYEMDELSGMASAVEEEASLVTTQASLSLPIQTEAQEQLMRMFRDPYVLEKEERTSLIQQLKNSVELQPHSADLRVLLGMALCVDLQAQSALGHLRAAVEIAPRNFVARLKLGELLMRLRITDQAEEQTHEAAKLAENAVQAELARRQAAAIRTMRREGIERGGYRGILSAFTRLLPIRREESRAAVVVSPR